MQNIRVIQHLRRAAFGTLALVTLSAAVTPAIAQWSTVYDQFYLPGPFNWAFRHNYPAGDRLFNAFDYGHAILYETLWNKPNAPVSQLEVKEYNFITRELLVHPPRVPLEEAAIEVAYAKLAPEAKMMFDWAHLLHRQIYDVWADERLSPAKKDLRVHELIRYYKTRPDLAFSSKPKSMELMEGQPYSLAFRRSYPKFNGLIWAYHWLQVGLYEPLLAGKDKDERQTGVLAAVARFRQMIEDPPTWMPRVMPMTPAVAPLFTARYPEAAIIFDNLHSMHDVVSDVLANPSVSRAQKRAEILRAAGRYRDATSFVIPESEWRDMAQMMGVANMGGPVLGVLEGFPQPTLERGAAMGAAGAHNMAGMAAMPGMAGMAGMEPTRATSADSGAGMAGMAGMAPMPGMPMHADSGQAMHEMMQQMMEMHTRMMADPVIRERMMADTALRRMMDSMMRGMSESGARTATPSLRPKPAARSTTRTTGRARPAASPARKRAATKQKPKPAAKPMDHSKMKMDSTSMPGMKMR